MDIDRLRALCKTQGIPDQYRGNVWKVHAATSHRQIAHSRTQALLGVKDNEGEPLSAWAASLDLPNQRVIRVDVERTRQELPEFHKQDTRDRLERLLTYYCKKRGAKYKQGLNELLAPMLMATWQVSVCDMFVGWWVWLTMFEAFEHAQYAG